MNIILSFMVVSFFALVTSAGVMADTKTFTVSASVPVSTSVLINAFEVNSASGTRTAIAGTALSFDPLLYNPSIGIYLPDHYFAIEASSAGGAGNTDVTVSYVEGANPNGAGKGLGVKTTATFAKVVGSTETNLTAHGPKKKLSDLTGAGEHVTGAELAGAFLRMYVGVVAKDPAAAVPDPASSEVITNADKSGAYSGSLVVTATVI